MSTNQKNIGCGPLKRFLARLLVGTLCLPYILTPAAAFAAPNRKAGTKIVYDDTQWHTVEKLLAEARRGAFEYKKTKAEASRIAAIAKFKEAFDIARFFPFYVAENEPGSFIPGGNANPNRNPLRGVLYKPGLVCGYALFEMGRLETPNSEARRSDLKEASHYLYKDFVSKKRDYDLPVIQLIGLMGQVEIYRSNLERSEDREKFRARIGEMDTVLKPFSDPKGRIREKIIEHLAQDKGLGTLLTRRDPDETRMEQYAKDFFDEVVTTLAEEISDPQLVLNPGTNNQFTYSFTKGVAPVKLIQTFGKDAQPSEKYVARNTDTLPAPPKLSNVALQVDQEYADLRTKILKLVDPDSKPEDYKKAIAWEQQEEAIEVQIAANHIETHGLQIPPGSVTLTNVKKDDQVIATLNGKMLPLFLIPETKETYSGYTANLPAAYGRTAELTLQVKRGEIQKAEEKITLVSDAKPEALVGLAADYSAFGLLVVRYTDFDKPTKVTVNGMDYPFAAQLVTSAAADSDGRTTYLLPLYSVQKLADVKVSTASATVVSASFTKLPSLSGQDKINIEALLVADLKIADRSLTSDQGDALVDAANAHPELNLKPLLLPVYQEQEKLVRATPKEGMSDKQFADKKQTAQARLERLALAAGLEKKDFDKKVQEYAYVAPAAPAVIKPPSLDPVIAWRTKDGLAVVSYRVQNMDSAKGDRLELIVNGTPFTNLQEAKGTVLVALASNGKGEIENDIEIRSKITQKNKPAILSIPCDVSAKEDEQKILALKKEEAAVIRNIAGGTTPGSFEELEKKGQTEAVERVAAQQIFQQINPVGDLHFKSDAEASKVYATLDAAQKAQAGAQGAYTLLKELESRKHLGDAGINVALSQYASMEQDIKLAYQLGEPQKSDTSDPDNVRVTVTTWARPGMLQFNGQNPLGVHREGNQLVFMEKPGTQGSLSLMGAPIQIAAQNLNIPKMQQITVEILLDDKPVDHILVSKNDNHRVTCKTNGTRLTYKWEILQNNNPLQLADADAPLLDLTADTIPQPIKGGGTATLQVKAFNSQGQMVAKGNAELTVISPDKGMAFIVGIDDYNGPDNIAYMDEDARQFADSLMDNYHYPSTSIYTVIAKDHKISTNAFGKKTEKSGLLTQAELQILFGDFVKKAQGDKTTHFIIYYCGHGEANAKGQDELQLPENGHIYEHEWAQKIFWGMNAVDKSLVSKMSVIGIYQACRPGAKIAQEQNGEKQNALLDKIGDQDLDHYYCALSSCMPGFQSLVDVPNGPEAAGIGHGYYGLALLNALKDLKSRKGFDVGDLNSKIKDKLFDILTNANNLVKPKDPFTQEIPPASGGGEHSSALYEYSSR